MDKNIEIRLLKNRIFEGVIFIFSILLIVPLFLIVFIIIQKGIAMINFEFLFAEKIIPGIKGGGILRDIIGSFILILFSTIFSVPMGICIGLYLAENPKSKVTFFVQWCIEILQGVPSIILGLIVYLWTFKTPLKFSGLSGSIALAIMMIPVVTKSTEETIKLIPHSFKEAAIALGVPYYKTIIKVILPAGLSGIVTGILLGIARIFGETAPLLLTAFGNMNFNTNIFKSMNSIPYLIYKSWEYGTPESLNAAWGASFVLISIILIINIITKMVVKKWKIQF
ncbi:MAG TPA: phosphate ABC transporter permease PstA [Spirochaetota bacterium]|nr:phosphate ABC transporter permease PstA [Spirochaetota bacterium]HOL57474.1 phosphate ABC transporter permease PstA [Spirochaetota bacterium]HPP05057.1 phosphate ABC transporter permease PstA [Spirochaetota bacterium]